MNPSKTKLIIKQRRSTGDGKIGCRPISTPIKANHKISAKDENSMNDEKRKVLAIGGKTYLFDFDQTC